MIPRTIIPSQDGSLGYNIASTLINVVRHHQQFPSKYRGFEYELLVTRIVELTSAPVVDYDTFLFDPFEQVYNDVDTWLNSWGCVDGDYVPSNIPSPMNPRQLFRSANFEGHGEEAITSEDETELTETVGALVALREPRTPTQSPTVMDIDTSNSFCYSPLTQ